MTISIFVCRAPVALAEKSLEWKQREACLSLIFIGLCLPAKTFLRLIYFFCVIKSSRRIKFYSKRFLVVVKPRSLNNKNEIFLRGEASRGALNETQTANASDQLLVRKAFVSSTRRYLRPKSCSALQGRMRDKDLGSGRVVIQARQLLLCFTNISFSVGLR